MSEAATPPQTILVKAPDCCEADLSQLLTSCRDLLRKDSATKVVEIRKDTAFDIQVPRRDADHFSLSVGLFTERDFSSEAAFDRACSKTSRIIKSCEMAFAFVMVDRVCGSRWYYEWEAHALAQGIRNEVSGASTNDVRARFHIVHLGVAKDGGADLEAWTAAADNTHPVLSSAGSSHMAVAWIVPALLKLSSNMSVGHRQAVRARFAREAVAAAQPDAIHTLLAEVQQASVVRGHAAADATVTSAHAKHAMTVYGEYC